MPPHSTCHAALRLSLFACVATAGLVAQDQPSYALLVQRGEAALGRFDLETAEARFGEALVAGEAAKVDLHELIELERRLARVQGLRGRLEVAIDTLRHAIDRLPEAPGSLTADRIACMHDLAVKLREKGDAAGSLDLLRRALALVKPETESADTVRLQLLDAFVKAAVSTADPAAILDGANQRAEILARVSGADSGDLILPLKQAAQALHTLGRDREAIPVIQRWIQIYEKIRGADNPGIAEGLENLLICETAAGELDDADSTLRRWVALLEKVTAEHPSLIDTSVWAARILTLRGRHAEAADQLEQALTRARSIMWDHKQQLGQIALALARESREAGRLDRAKTALQDARKYHATFGPATVEALQLAIESAHQALAEGSPDEAATAMEATVASLETRLGAEHRSLVEPLEILSRAYLALDRKPAAEAAAQRARSIAGKH